MTTKVGRPRKAAKSKPVKITTTPKLLIYLGRIAGKEALGSTPSEVARTLVWEGVRNLIRDGFVDEVVD